MNAAAAPFCREAGSPAAAAGVICLHSNASNSGQWRALMERLADDFHVLAPDSYGAGKGPALPKGRALSLADEVALIEPLLARRTEPWLLVGHSYGAAIALKAALLHPQRVRAVVAYEPTLFGLLEDEAPDSAALAASAAIHAAASSAEAFVQAGDLPSAARAFIDYWMGPGSFDAMPAPRQQAVAASMAPIGAWLRAVFSEPARRKAWTALTQPVFALSGAASPAAARGVVRILGQALPSVRMQVFDGLGHMGPVTDAAAVNAVIERFLREHLGSVRQ